MTQSGALWNEGKDPESEVGDMYVPLEGLLSVLNGSGD